ncbi:MAG: hypothetical protein DI549_11795 [Ancylobacter novellus]|uniref:Uncharacterized protein n=1 Tax=Ancylobacter novellus TaxID=921 RepID=A0A2W5SRZ2_ANCNO|nr:MAG: hypothetical protein DI549_11795 [Ancylobacter novellus]
MYVEPLPLRPPEIVPLARTTVAFPATTPMPPAPDVPTGELCPPLTVAPDPISSRPLERLMPAPPVPVSPSVDPPCRTPPLPPRPPRTVAPLWSVIVPPEDEIPTPPSPPLPPPPPPVPPLPP